MKFLRRLIYAASLCAVSVVLTRLLSLPVGDIVRLSLGNVPILLAGLWLGPLWGAAVGFCADFIGATIFSSWFPPLALAPTLLGMLVSLFAGRKCRVWRTIPAVIVALLICELGIKPYALHLLLGQPWANILTLRLPFTVAQTVAETTITTTLAVVLTPFIRKKLGDHSTV